MFDLFDRNVLVAWGLPDLLLAVAAAQTATAGQLNLQSPGVWGPGYFVQMAPEPPPQGRQEMQHQRTPLHVAVQPPSALRDELSNMTHETAFLPPPHSRPILPVRHSLVKRTGSVGHGEGAFIVSEYVRL